MRRRVSNGHRGGSDHLFPGLGRAANAVAPVFILVTALTIVPEAVAGAAPSAWNDGPDVQMATSGTGSVIAPPRHTALRGLLGEFELEYDGPPLRAMPDQGVTAPVVVRVTPLPAGDGAAYGRAGTGSPRRYRVDYIGAVAGIFDLRELIQHEDGSAAALPPLTVEILSTLPPEHGTDLYASKDAVPLLRRHYRTALLIVALAWLAVPVVYLLRRALRRQPPPVEEPPPPRPTLADQLRPLVERAMRGELTIAEQGRLELLLLSHWRRRLDLDGLPPSTAIARLRTSPEAGRLLVAVERWLHTRDGGGARAEGDVAELLEPYRHAPAFEEAELGTGSRVEPLAGAGGSTP